VVLAIETYSHDHKECTAAFKRKSREGDREWERLLRFASGLRLLVGI